MFWWSVPVGYSGFLVMAIFGILSFLSGYVFLEGDVDPPRIFYAAFWVFFIAFLIGILMMLGGFFLWALGEIWLPYI